MFFEKYIQYTECLIVQILYLKYQLHFFGLVVFMEASCSQFSLYLCFIIYLDHVMYAFVFILLSGEGKEECNTHLYLTAKHSKTIICHNIKG